MSKGGLSTFDESSAEVGNAECSLVWARDAVVDDRCEGQVDVVLGHADLLWHLDNLDLDVDLNEALGQWVDLDESWVDGAGESSELGDQTDVSLRDCMCG